MAAKAIREAKGKQLLSMHLSSVIAPVQAATFNTGTSWDTLVAANPWLNTQKLVVKPDQLIKRRGKLGLIKVNVDLTEVKKWIAERIDKDIQIGKAVGKLNNFIIEPFIAHNQQDEYYVCIYSHRDGETILFHHEGGVDIGDADSKSLKLIVPIDDQLKQSDLTSKLLINVANQKRKEMLTTFITGLFECYMDLHFTYLEINPVVCTDNGVHVLDLACKIDQTADYLCKSKWGDSIDFPPPFGRDAYPEEAYIAELDSKSGASLKLTILNPKGRIWTMVAGGGASVIYSDTICDLGGSSELANYGEYSGAPSEQQTYEYAKTVLNLMTKEKHPNGKVLLIGGGIANFTNVAATFKGIVKALQEFCQKIIDNNIVIYVRRGGPNYQEGLRVMKEVGQSLGIQMHVFGPETHMTAIVGMALNNQDIPKPTKPLMTTANFLLPSNSYNESVDSDRSRSNSTNTLMPGGGQANGQAKELNDYVSINKEDVIKPLFTDKTRAIVWGMQNKAFNNIRMYNNNNNNNNNSMYRIPNRIFVGGIPQTASQDELRDYFAHFGHVKDARIITDPRGNSKGFGFVTYDSENDASKVLSLKEEELIFKENKLNIGHAFRKKNFSNTNNYNNNNNGMGVNNGMGGMGGNGMGGGNPHLHLMNGGNNGFNSGGLGGLGGNMSLGGNGHPNSYLDNQMSHPMGGGGAGGGGLNGFNANGLGIGHNGMGHNGIGGYNSMKYDGHLSLGGMAGIGLTGMNGMNIN